MIDLDAALAAAEEEEIIKDISASDGCSADLAAASHTSSSAALAAAAAPAAASGNRAACIDLDAVLGVDDDVVETTSSAPAASGAAAASSVSSAAVSSAAASSSPAAASTATSTSTSTVAAAAAARRRGNARASGRAADPVLLEAEDDDECIATGASHTVDDGSCMMVDSDSDSSSSSSSARSRTPRATKTALGGAAAAAALMTAAAPLDLEEVDSLIQRELIFPTEDALQLQHEGTLVQVMAETGATVSVTPGDDDLSLSTLKCEGTASAVGKAVWELEQLHKALIEKKVMVQADAFLEEMNRIEELEIPQTHLAAVVGANGSDIAPLRKRCGGIMIALKPPETPTGAYVACLGPGDGDHVERALNELKKKLEEAIGS